METFEKWIEMAERLSGDKSSDEIMLDAYAQSVREIIDLREHIIWRAIHKPLRRPTHLETCRCSYCEAYRYEQQVIETEKLFSK
jgi:hypothetical protein